MAAARPGFLIRALACATLVGPLFAQTASWTDIDTAQQRVLAPLEGEWARMSEVDRQAWLGIVRGFDRLLPDEQERIRQRMRDWARLTPEQREHARDQYRVLRNIPVERRETLHQQWLHYRDLPAQEKKVRPATGARGPAAGQGRSSEDEESP